MKRLIAIVALMAACSEQVPLGTQGTKCEYDEQCSQNFVCKCIRRRNPDDEGPDEILAPGFCTTADNFQKQYGGRCPSDAGVADTSFDAPPPIDSEPPETASDAVEDSTDASDGG